MTTVNYETGEVVAAVFAEAEAATVTDDYLFGGIEDPRVVSQLRARLADGRLSRGTLYRAAQMRHANQVGKSPRRKSSRVYFIAAERTGLIKIGTSVNPSSRLATLQTGSPDRLSLLGTLPGDVATEHALHQRFAADRTHGEWFRPSPSLLAYIKEATA